MQTSYFKQLLYTIRPLTQTTALIKDMDLPTPNAWPAWMTGNNQFGVQHARMVTGTALLQTSALQQQDLSNSHPTQVRSHVEQNTTCMHVSRCLRHYLLGVDSTSVVGA